MHSLITAARKYSSCPDSYGSSTGRARQPSRHLEGTGRRFRANSRFRLLRASRQKPESEGSEGGREKRKERRERKEEDWNLGARTATGLKRR